MKALLFLWLCLMLPLEHRITDEREAILAVLRTQVADWNKGDVRAFMQGYKRSDSTKFISAKGIEQGYEKILQRYLQRYPDKAAMGTLKFEGLSVMVLSENYAVVNGQFILQRRAASGNEEVLSGYFTLLFEKTREGWKIILDHTS
jgi:ketosteroid isomerase-like protein